MSVALEDQGDTVPIRGTASRNSPTGFAAGGGSPYWSRRSSSEASRSVSGSATSTKCQYSAATALSDGSSAASCELSLSSRNAERAGPPRSFRMEGISDVPSKTNYKTRVAHVRGAPTCAAGFLLSFEQRCG